MKRYIQPYLPGSKERKLAAVCKNCGEAIYLSGVWYHVHFKNRLCDLGKKAEPDLFLEYFNQLSDVSNTEISSR